MKNRQKRRKGNILKGVIGLLLILGMVLPQGNLVMAEDSQKTVSSETSVSEQTETAKTDSTVFPTTNLTPAPDPETNQTSSLTVTQEAEADSSVEQAAEPSSATEKKVESGSTEAQTSETDFFVSSTSSVPSRVIRRAPASGNSNLNEFTIQATINAEQDGNGTYVIKKGSTYVITLSFQEDPNGSQFVDPLVYTLPAGFQEIDQTFKPFDINVEEGSGSYKVSGNTITLADGKLTVNFNKNDANWSHLEKARNTQFDLLLKGTFDDNAKELDWGNGKKTSLKVDTSGSLTTTKQASYNQSDGKVHYTVTVSSNGYNEDVLVKDSLTGTALTYDKNVQRSDQSGINGTVNTQTDRGFEYKIPNMANGQTITLTYTASVDFNALGGDPGTEEQVGNSVVTTSKQQPNSEPVKENWNGQIDYLSLSKNSGNPQDAASGHKTIPWTVTYNANPKGSAAGRTITDSIADSSKDILKYSGDGITITVKDAFGAVIRTDNVSWDKIGVSDKNTASSWHYTIPDGDQNKAYQYTVSYTTDADMTGLVKNATVNNSAHDDKNHTANASAQVDPGPDSKIGVAKTCIAKDNQKISWEVTLTVPKGGLKTAQIIDKLPTQYIDNQQRYDIWDDSTVNVTGLLDGEDIVKDAAKSDQTQAVYTFYQDKNHTQTGLKEGDNSRTITVTFETKINQDWVEKADQSYMMKHTNTVDFIGNEQTVTASAETEVVKQEISKKMEKTQNITINGVTYPAWYFVLTLKGAQVSDFDTPVDVTDTFDSRLRYVDPTEQINGLDYLSSAGKLAAAYNNIPWDAARLSATVEDGKVVFHIKSADIQKIIKNNWSINELHIGYWLVAKDRDSLNSIMKEAAKNQERKTFLFNTASWAGNSSDAAAEYNYPGLSKKLLTDRSKLTTTDGTQPVAAYELDANPAGAQIGDGTTLILKDAMSSNQVLNPQSVQITPSEGTSYTVSKGTDGGQILIFTIPDKTPVTIVYSATVTGGNGSQSLKNTAEMAGYKSLTENTATKSAGSGGSATNYSVTVFKYEEGDLTKKLSGCTFELHEADSNPNKKWNGEGKTFTTGSDGTVVVEPKSVDEDWGLMPGIKYYLVEKSAPDGYQLDQTKHYFTISKDAIPDEDNNIYMNGATIAVSDKKTEEKPETGSLEITKTTSGAATPDETRFEITGPNSYSLKKTYKEFTDGKLTLTGLTPGVYTVTEEADTAAVQGYSLTVGGDNGVQKTVEKGKTAAVSIKNTYSHDEGSLEITKTTSGAATPDDTSFEITGPNHYSLKKTYKEFTDGKLTLTGLTPGVYTVTEEADTAAVQGYSLTVGGDNGVKKSVAKDDTTKVEITNTYNKINLFVSKTDLTSGAEVKGAKITVYDADGREVTSWTSDGTEHDFGPSLKAGEKYTIVEEGAPAGYAYVNKIALEVGKDGKMTVTGTEGNFTYDEKTGKLEIKDEKISYQIEKLNPNGKPLNGADFRVTDEKGKEIDKWTSDGKKHSLNTSVMEAGKLYTLTEVKAPSGYKSIGSINIKLNKDGSLYIEGKTYQNGSTIQITDQAVKTTASDEKKNQNGQAQISAVKTGDTSDLALLTVIGILALSAFILILMQKKKYRNGN